MLQNKVQPIQIQIHIPSPYPCKLATCLVFNKWKKGTEIVSTSLFIKLLYMLRQQNIMRSKDLVDMTNYDQKLGLVRFLLIIKTEHEFGRVSY